MVKLTTSSSLSPSQARTYFCVFVCVNAYYIASVLLRNSSSSPRPPLSFSFFHSSSPASQPKIFEFARINTFLMRSFAHPKVISFVIVAATTFVVTRNLFFMLQITIIVVEIGFMSACNWAQKLFHFIHYFDFCVQICLYGMYLCSI